MPTEGANPKYVALIAFIAAGVLITGSMLKPKNQTPETPVSPGELARLQRLAQRKSVEDLSVFISEVADRVAPHLVYLKAIKSSGVVWSTEGVLVTSNGRDRFPDSVAILNPKGNEMDARTTITSPDLPVATLQGALLPEKRPIRVRLPDQVKPGEWILAVWLSPEGKHVFAPVWFSGVASSSCGQFAYRQLLSDLPFHEAMRGGGLFDLDGNFIGIIIRCEDSYVAMAPEDVEETWRLATSLDRQILRRYGIRVEPLDEVMRAYFKAETGLLITEVWRGYLGEALDLLPGDLIRELNGNPVQALNDLAALAQSGTDGPLKLRVRREGRHRTVTLAPQEPSIRVPSGVSSDSAIILRPPPTGLLIETVEPDSRAARAGIRPGDRLLRIGTRPILNLNAFRIAMSSARQEPTFCVLERAEKKWGVLLR